MKKQSTNNKHVYRRQIVKYYFGIGFLALAAVALVAILLLPDKETEEKIEVDVPQFVRHGSASFTNDRGNLIVDFDIEIADNPETMAQGLMHRVSMEPNQGMLFVYPEPENLSFWMKNTYIPLDIIFIGADSLIVSVHPDTKPFSEEPITSSGPAKFVLEVIAGTAKKYDLQPGTKFSWLRENL